MTSSLGRHLDTWGARARTAEMRADAEAERAQRAEKMAEQDPPTLRELHAMRAIRHRRNEDLHRTSARMHRSLVAQLGPRPGRPSVGLLVARAVASASGCPSSAIVLLAGDRSAADFVATDPLAEAAQDLEFVHDEGPLLAACATGVPHVVAVSDFERVWPRYGQELAALGVLRAVAAPLRAGSTVFGAVGLFDPPPSALGGQSLEGLATGLTPVLLERDAKDEASEGSLPLGGMREIHQAAGVVAVEAGCDVRSALALLRARAFACEEPAATIARRILDGELHLSL